jgi:hypothetical protein
MLNDEITEPLGVDSPPWKRRIVVVREKMFRNVSGIELAFWTLGLGTYIGLNTLNVYWEQLPALRDPFLYVLLVSLYKLPNGALISLLLFVFLIYLTFSVAPITGILGQIRSNFVQEMLQSERQIERQIEDLDNETARLTRSEPVIRKVDDIQSDNIRRSRAVARSASTRPQVLLFVGALIAFGGLIFFVVTLPQEINPLVPNMGLLGKSPPSGTEAGAGLTPEQFGILTSEERSALLHIKTAPERFLNDVLPRLLMLLFIQVLAGFFLRQYRAGVEDFRYYEAILRRRETEVLAYELYRAHQNEGQIQEYITKLLSGNEFGLLTKGQTTMVLEAAKASENELQTTVEKILSKIDITSLLKR